MDCKHTQIGCHGLTLDNLTRKLKTHIDVAVWDEGTFMIDDLHFPSESREALIGHLQTYDRGRASVPTLCDTEIERLRSFLEEHREWSVSMQGDGWLVSSPNDPMTSRMNLTAALDAAEKLLEPEQTEDELLLEIAREAATSSGDLILGSEVPDHPRIYKIKGDDGWRFVAPPLHSAVTEGPLAECYAAYKEWRKSN